MEDKLLEHCKRLEQKLLSLEYENKRLNKALDKASETLAKSKFKMTCGEARKKCMENHCFGSSCIHSRNFTKEEWKAWCLHE